MKAEIKDWFIEEHFPIADWEPADRSDVEFWCTLEIGEVDAQGTDMFQVHVVTERAIRNLENKEYLFVIPYYESWESTLELLKDKVSGFDDVSWSGLSEQLSEVFYWEYHNYIL